jgi:Leucine-rich repeat (LRR) protein
MSGSVPVKFFENKSLRSLDLSFNELSGRIAGFAEGTKITMLNLASNNFLGTIPSEIQNARDLSSLNIATNTFSGTLPSQLFSLPLTELAIGGNLFEGTIPTQLQDVSTLTSLSLGPNLFVDEIPSFLGRLTNLERLSMFGITQLGGKLPASYGLSLTKLQEFSLYETNVGGNIPEQFGAMTDLEILRLNGNSLAREIPASLGLLTNLGKIHPKTQILAISSIHTNIHINFFFLCFGNIVTLQLNDNDFTGIVPGSLGSLTALEQLQFHNNRLFGTIPDSFSNLSQLSMSKAIVFFNG